MNIFILDKDIDKCAEAHVDRHVIKMILESAQMLCTAHHACPTDATRPEKFYKQAHLNHPSTIWVRTTVANYEWMIIHALALCEEYTHRYGKIHSTNALLNDVLSNAPKNIKQEGWREPPPAMQHYPQCIVQGDSIQSYKNYYNEAKAYFAKWSKREQPEWFVGSMT